MFHTDKVLWFVRSLYLLLCGCGRLLWQREYSCGWLWLTIVVVMTIDKNLPIQFTNISGLCWLVSCDMTLK